MPTSVAGNKTVDIVTPDHAERAGGRGRAVVRRRARCGHDGHCRRLRNGFTLIELMVVVTIIGLASAAAVLAMPDPRGRLADEAARFGLRVRAAHDLAIVEARPVSVWVTSAGYGFDQWRGGRWVPIGEKPLRVATWQEGTRAQVVDRARVTFDETGMADRAIAVPVTRGRVRTDIAIDANGAVRVDG